jgi:hypothetical protein
LLKLSDDLYFVFLRALFQSMKWILTTARERDRAKILFAPRLAELVIRLDFVN